MGTNGSTGPLSARRCARLLLVPTLAAGVPAGAAGVSTGTDEQARLPYWEVRDEHMSLRLVQRLPDQTRAFFMARGFSPEHSERIAQSCVFQTVFKNVSAPSAHSALEYNLHEWVVNVGGGQQGMKTREDWSREWEAAAAPTPARIAFEWALLPTQQRYAAGDYNWGMSIFNLKPGTAFDLKVVWHQHGRERSVLIRDVQCAPDIHPDPQTFGQQ